MPDSSHDLNAVTSLITAEHARALMVDLARVPSPLTELLEAEPKLRAFIDIAVEPRLREMGLTDIHRDSMGNLLATCGRGTSGRSLMLVTNAMNQPAATMPNSYGGEVRDGTPYGLPGEVVLGKGLSEQKAPLAAILLALRSILAAGYRCRANSCSCAACPARPGVTTPSAALSRRPARVPRWRFSMAPATGSAWATEGAST